MDTAERHDFEWRFNQIDRMYPGLCEKVDASTKSIEEMRSLYVDRLFSITVLLKSKLLSKILTAIIFNIEGILVQVALRPKYAGLASRIMSTDPTTVQLFMFYDKYREKVVRLCPIQSREAVKAWNFAFQSQSVQTDEREGCNIS